MKNILTLFCLLPVMAFAQPKEDYQSLMDRFVTFYNQDQNDSICTLMSDYHDGECFWKTVNERESSKQEYGAIQSYKYLGKLKAHPTKLAVFKVVFEKKGVKAMSFALDENDKHKFSTFRFDTSSDKIEKMLAASQ